MRGLRAIASLVALILLSSAAYASCAKDQEAERVRTFVNQGFIHGVPSSEAKQFNSDRDIETLVCQLRDPEESLYWSNIITVLGMRGNSKATDPLINFINNGDGTISEE